MNDDEEDDGHYDHDDEYEDGRAVPRCVVPQERIVCSDEFNSWFDSKYNRVTQPFVDLRKEGYSYLVFHNVEYGITGEFAVFALSGAPDVGDSLYSNCVAHVIRSYSGCGTSEMKNYQSYAYSDKSTHNLVNHILFSYVFPEPGPKFIFGVTTIDEEIKGWDDLASFQAPHDQWEPRNLRLVGCSYKTLPIPTKLPKYVYLPGQWSWDDDFCDYNIKQFRGKIRKAYRHHDVSMTDVENIPYLSILTDREKFDKHF